MIRREASHAGSWYSENEATLTRQLDGWLNHVDESIEGIGNIPQPGARVIIAPHAGYAYSGPAAAWAYKALDLSKTERVFLLGPSHHAYLSGCALSQCTHYSTPLGDLALDEPLIKELHTTERFDKMTQSIDEEEHSLEMHLPYIYEVLSKAFPGTSSFPPLVPILVGSTRPDTEKMYGEILAPYLADPTSVFVISSDFCHWGSRFSYTYYLPSSASSASEGHSLRSRDKPPLDPPIHKSIARIDNMAMEAVKSGSHDAFLNNLQETGNTVCGRHPIGVMMAAIETLRKQGRVVGGKGKFKFVRYERSSDCVKVSDSSVSYASAFAVL